MSTECLRTVKFDGLCVYLLPKGGKTAFKLALQSSPILHLLQLDENETRTVACIEWVDKGLAAQKKRKKLKQKLV